MGLCPSNYTQACCCVDLKTCVIVILVVMFCIAFCVVLGGGGAKKDLLNSVTIYQNQGTTLQQSISIRNVRSTTSKPFFFTIKMPKRILGLPCKNTKLRMRRMRRLRPRDQHQIYFHLIKKKPRKPWEED